MANPPSLLHFTRRQPFVLAKIGARDCDEGDFGKIGFGEGRIGHGFAAT